MFNVPLTIFIPALAAAYILGSVPFGLIFAKVFCKIDPRLEGSKNVGATNVARLCGKFWGLMTLVFDALKGGGPVALALFVGKFTPFEASCVALAALLGHTFSIFLRFRGGKGVATTVGIFLPLALWQLVVSAAICVAVIYRTGFVSAGALVLVACLAALELVTWAVTGQWQIVPLSLVVLALVVARHHENIRRLVKGEEKPWQKKKDTV